MGIIGVVAALTLPNLIQKNNNKVVEARLAKFYSSINQAIQMAEVRYGDKKIWYEDTAGAEIDENGNPIEGSSGSEKWFNKYLRPHLNVVKQETLPDGTFIAYFADGSALMPRSDTTRDWFFYPGNVTKCLAKPGRNGICSFSFNFYPASTSESWKYHYNKGMEPYKYIWDGDIGTLYTHSEYGCNASSRYYCTAIIQMNGWKIPDDYPYKVSY